MSLTRPASDRDLHNVKILRRLQILSFRNLHPPYFSTPISLLFSDMADLEKTAHSSLKFAQEQPLLLRPSRLRRVMCILALGHSGHREHWTSAQCDEAFEQVGDRMHSIVVKCLFMVSPSHFKPCGPKLALTAAKSRVGLP
jgi:hypothetical protein